MLTNFYFLTCFFVIIVTCIIAIAGHISNRHQCCEYCVNPKEEIEKPIL